MIILLGLVLIIAGIVRLAFPEIARALNRFSNEFDGVETRHGQLFEVGRVIGGVALIVAGIMVWRLA